MALHEDDHEVGRGVHEVAHDVHVDGVLQAVLKKEWWRGRVSKQGVSISISSCLSS